jgi:hypothetical protein
MSGNAGTTYRDLVEQLAIFEGYLAVC